ncbi:MAG: hypothetical protein AAF628_28975 [Planctomycetota bacterium]
MALDFSRQKTAKQLLEIDWQHPVWKPEVEDAGAGRTVSVMREYALPIDEAYALVADGDQRPLLILRECERCKGTDHALLSRTMDNEQTVLLTSWFRCVKLPPNVLGETHPFSNLFKQGEGVGSPHLFFADHNGAHHTPLPGDQAQSQLWRTMFAYLDRNYEGDARKSLKGLRKLLDQFDRLDSREQDVKARMEREIDKRGARSPKLRKLKRQLDELAKERDALRASEKKLRALALTAASESTEAEQPAAAGAG